MNHEPDFDEDEEDEEPEDDGYDEPDDDDGERVAWNWSPNWMG